MKTLDPIQLSRSRKMALAALTTAWGLDLGYGLLVTEGLSLIKVTLMLLSLTLAFSKNKSGAIGCALTALLMTVISGGQAAALSENSLSPQLIASLVTLTLFFLASLLFITPRSLCDNETR